jgi:hypothetical protein
MINDNLGLLNRQQLDERFDAAIKRVREVQIAYAAKSSNLSENLGGRMPEVSAFTIQELDDELQSAQDDLKAIAQEIQRRKSS